MKIKDEKKAIETVTKLQEKYLKTKDPNYFEIMTFLADINIFLAQRLKNIDLLVKGIGELLILDFFAKKFSEDQKFWSNKFHRDIKEKSKFLINTLKIPINEKILGKETLTILKQIELETKDHIYIDKILEIKQSDKFQNKIDDLRTIIQSIKDDEASPVVYSMAINELITSLAQQNKYNEAFEEAKNATKEIKRIKNKQVKDYLLGETYLNLFRVNIRRQDYKQAEKEAKKAIEFFEENINTLSHACFAIFELASLYMTQERLDKASSLLEKPTEFSEHILSPDLLARLYELLGGINLKSKDFHNAALYFGASALFYLISDDQEKYREFITLAINLYNRYLKSRGFIGVQFE
ncbi:MAG: hypothetical protein ACTSYB_04000 [Candidatus Helarchaeota archaeon]